MGIIETAYYNSPVGELIVGSYAGCLCLCDWRLEKRRHIVDRRICRQLNSVYVDRQSDTVRQAVSQLDEYFAGKRNEFTLPLLLAGTDFQRRVWAELMALQYGTTISYRDVAARLGYGNAVRAVANAIAANPISIFVPCHRVIGSDHRLTGYAGGLDAKLALISIESQEMSLI